MLTNPFDHSDTVEKCNHFSLMALSAIIWDTHEEQELI